MEKNNDNRQFACRDAASIGKRLTLLFCICLLLINGQALAQVTNKRRIHLPGGNIKVFSLLEEFRAQTGYSWYYKGDPVDLDKQVMTTKGRWSVSGIMFLLADQAGLEYICIKDNFIISRRTRPRLDSAAIVKVFVVDDNRKPLACATLHLIREGTTVMTNHDGSAVLSIRRFPDRLVSTAVGRQADTLQLEAPQVAHILLRQNITMLGEAVVTDGDYPNYTRRKTNLGGRDRTYWTAGLGPSPENMLGALTGRVPGLLVTQTSGVHGAAQSVELRGKMSIMNGRDPLFIIDGVPFAPNNRSVSNIPGGSAAGSLSPFSFLESNNIRSIEILKDAGASAMYGSRAANGVILVNTFNSTPLESPWTLHFSSGISMAGRLPRLMNTRQYIAMRREALAQDELSGNLQHAPYPLTKDTVQDLNWSKRLLGGLAPTINAGLKWSVQTARSSHYISADYRQESDVFLIRPTHRLLSLMMNDRYNMDSARWSLKSHLWVALDDNRQTSEDLTRLQYLAPNKDLLPPAADNRLLFTNNSYKARSVNYIAGIDLSYRLDSNFSFKNNIGISGVHVSEQSVMPVDPQKPADTAVRSRNEAVTTYNRWVVQPQLIYHRQDKALKSLFETGLSLQGSYSDVRTVSSIGFPTSYAQNELYRSLFLHLNFTWKESLALDLTGTNDARSRPGAGTHAGNFGAVSAAWAFSEWKEFHRLLPIFSFAKLRGSWGVLGNDQVGDGYRYGGSTTPPPSLRVSDNKAWESVVKQELGMECGLFDDRLWLVTSWYRNYSLDQLLPAGPIVTQSLPVTLLRLPVRVVNTGWEFEIGFHAIAANGIKWNTSFNGTIPINRLRSFPGLSSTIFNKTLVEGQPLTVVHGFQYTGVDPLDGVFTFRDLNGDGRLTDADKQVIGQLAPTFFGGCLNELSWHRWQASILVEGRIQRGFDAQSLLYAFNPPGSTIAGALNNATKALLDRWRRPGDQAVYQRLTTGADATAIQAINNYIKSNASLTDASFARMKSFSLSYRFLPGILSKRYLNELKCTLVAENLLTLTPYKQLDPEIQNPMILPPSKRIYIKLQLTFK